MDKTIWIIVVIVVIVGGSWIYYEKKSASDDAGNVKMETTGANNYNNSAPAVTNQSSNTVETSVSVTTNIVSVKEFTVNGSNFSFSPSSMSVKKGDRVKITLKNTGGFHDLRIEGYDVGTSQIQAGQEASFEFTADKAGTFVFYCSIGNHRAMGMVGTMTVN